MPSLDLNLLFWIEKFIAVAVIFQTFELIQIRRVLAADGIWNWDILRKDWSVFPKPIQKGLDLLLDYPNVLALLGIRLLAAVGTLPFNHHPALISILFLSTLFICLRRRGSFNGGSDSMTLSILLALTAASFFSHKPKVVSGCIWYIAIQTCLSYFIAGITKLKSRKWRSGQALSEFFRSSYYSPPRFLQKNISTRPMLCWAASWGVILFECSYPLALISPEVCQVFIALSVLFHLTNVYAFGLNRFLFAWSAAYPALFYCSTLLIPR